MFETRHRVRRRRTHGWAAWIAAALMCWAGAGQAQTSSADAQDEAQSDPVELEISVTANRDATERADLGSSETVIGRREIETRNQLTVGDLLRTVPGLEVTQAGGAGKQTAIRLRGASPSQTLVLLDGVRLNTTTNADVDFAHLMADNLERIEIVRGPQATYGSEAMAGVVNLITRRAEGAWSGSLSVEAGTREHERLAASLTASPGPVDFSLTGSDWSTQSVSQIPGTEPDPYENRTWSARVGGDLPGDGRVDLTWRDVDGDVALDGFGVEDLNALARNEGQQASLAVHKRLLPRWNQTARIGGSATDLEGVDPDTFFNNYRIESDTQWLEAQADLDLTPRSSDQWHTVNLGWSSERRDGFNRGGFDEDADIDSWFVQSQWSPVDSLHLTGAVRRDDHSVFGGETSWRATGNWSTSEGSTRVRGSYGTAFRAPNFNELFFPFSGDPGLLPETSVGWDLGVQRTWRGGKLRFDLAVFELDLDNLIQFDLGTFRFANIAEARSRGVELDASYGGKRFELTLGHTINETEDGAGGQLARRPKHRTTFVGRFVPVEGLDAAVMVVAVRDRVESTGQPMDDYERVDLSLRYAALPWLRPYLRVENALDADFQEVPGFVTPGATFMVGVSLFR